jgi:hypothetical protein
MEIDQHALAHNMAHLLIEFPARLTQRATL